MARYLCPLQAVECDPPPWTIGRANCLYRIVKVCIHEELRSCRCLPFSWAIEMAQGKVGAWHEWLAALKRWVGCPIRAATVQRLKDGWILTFQIEPWMMDDGDI
jgi:hypothetical protein